MDEQTTADSFFFAPSTWRVSTGHRIFLDVTHGAIRARVMPLCCSFSSRVGALWQVFVFGFFHRTRFFTLMSAAFQPPHRERRDRDTATVWHIRHAARRRLLAIVSLCRGQCTREVTVNVTVANSALFSTGGYFLLVWKTHGKETPSSSNAERPLVEFRRQWNHHNGGCQIDSILGTLRSHRG